MPASFCEPDAVRKGPASTAAQRERQRQARRDKTFSQVGWASDASRRTASLGPRRRVTGPASASRGSFSVRSGGRRLLGGTEAAGLEELEQAAVALIDSADRVGDSGLCIREEEQAALTAAGGAFHLAHIAVRAQASLAELGEKLGFEVGGDGVLQAFGLIMYLPPLHAEQFGQHPLD